MRIVDMPEFKDKSQILSFEEDIPLLEAIKAMAAKDYGACIVTRQGELAGIFTERDVLKKVAAKELDMKKTALKQVMSKELRTAQAADPVADCIRRMSQGRFRHLPVVDENKKVIGLLSQGDFVAYNMSTANDMAMRLSHAAKEQVAAAKSRPIRFILAITAYTLALLYIFSAVEIWLRNNY